jgi:hypothetical protein
MSKGEQWKMGLWTEGEQCKNHNVFLSKLKIDYQYFLGTY